MDGIYMILLAIYTLCLGVNSKNDSSFWKFLSLGILAMSVATQILS
jgi:hypothetical protein